jgi:tRNA G18 (ribose-2'-O)-methylase SpoU
MLQNSGRNHQAAHRLAAGTISFMRMSGPVIIEITSLDDPRVDVYRNVRDADLRGREHLFMAESELVLRRLMNTPGRLHSMLISPEKLARMREAIDRLPQTVPVYVADLKLIHEIAAFHIHRGCLAAGFRPEEDALSLQAVITPLQTRERCCLLLAEGVTNVDNMGALFRNAAAFGVDAIVLDSLCCDPLYRKAIRVSMGHVLSIPYAVSADWLNDLERLKKEWGLTLVAAELAVGAVPLWEMPTAPRLGMVFGSEGHGLPRATLDACDAVCAIPMSKAGPSLNVAVASAVFLYERSRRDS